MYKKVYSIYYVQFTAYIMYKKVYSIYYVQFTAYYNTVTVFIRAKRGGTIVSLQIVLLTDGTAL
jgi:hypothetical protein